MADGWTSLALQISSCVACPDLVATRTEVVVGERPTYGPPGGPVRLAIVGEGPGAQEDAAGRPFVGKAGQLLDQLLVDSGMARAEVALLNVVKCRPPRNRAPRADEIARC